MTSRITRNAAVRWLALYTVSYSEGEPFLYFGLRFKRRVPNCITKLIYWIVQSTTDQIHPLDMAEGLRK